MPSEQKGDPVEARTRVLFLCTGNSARSQMAEAFLRYFAGERFEAHSAGLEPREIDPMTRRVMKEAGVDMEGQRSKGVEEYMGKMHFGFLITLCTRSEKSCPSVFPGAGRRLEWPVEDPASVTGPERNRLAAFRRVRDELLRLVVDFAGREAD